MANFPTVIYSNLKHKVDNGLSGGAVQTRDEVIEVTFTKNAATLTSYKASFVSPYNEITGTLRSDRELKLWDVRVTPIENSQPSPGEGLRAISRSGIAANTNTSFIIPITATAFTGSASNTYRVSLMAQSMLDGTWDVTQLYLVLNSHSSSTYNTFKPSSSDGYAVHCDGDVE